MAVLHNLARLYSHRQEPRRGATDIGQWCSRARAVFAHASRQLSGGEHGTAPIHGAFSGTRCTQFHKWRGIWPLAPLSACLCCVLASWFPPASTARDLLDVMRALPCAAGWGNLAALCQPDLIHRVMPACVAKRSHASRPTKHVRDVRPRHIADICPVSHWQPHMIFLTCTLHQTRRI